MKGLVSQLHAVPEGHGGTTSNTQSCGNAKASDHAKSGRSKNAKVSNVLLIFFRAERFDATLCFVNFAHHYKAQLAWWLRVQLKCFGWHFSNGFGFKKHFKLSKKSVFFFVRCFRTIMIWYLMCNLHPRFFGSFTSWSSTVSENPVNLKTLGPGQSCCCLGEWSSNFFVGSVCFGAGIQKKTQTYSVPDP